MLLVGAKKVRIFGWIPLKASDIYDPEETRGGGHAAAFNALPDEQQTTFRLLQEVLQLVVDIWNDGEFRPTSGWRWIKANTAVGGRHNSLHIWALARDFVNVSGRHPPRVPKGFRVIRSSDCWHVQYDVRRCG